MTRHLSSWQSNIAAKHLIGALHQCLRTGIIDVLWEILSKWLCPTTIRARYRKHRALTVVLRFQLPSRVLVCITILAGYEPRGTHFSVSSDGRSCFAVANNIAVCLDEFTLLFQCLAFNFPVHVHQLSYR